LEHLGMPVDIDDRMRAPSQWIKACTRERKWPHRLGFTIAAGFIRDQSGAYLVAAALAMPVLTGIIALGSEVGLWYYKHRTAQGAADSSALTAATAHYRDGGVSDLTVQANSVAASYGLAAGTNGVTVTVNQPPKSGPNVATPRAVEVIISQPQKPLLSAMWNSQPVTISARAVAKGNGGKGCVLALDPTAGGSATVQGTAQVKLNECGLLDNSSHGSAVTVGGSGTIAAQSVSVVGGISGAAAITATDGILTGQNPAADPYATTTFPSFSGCTENNYKVQETKTLSPGVYCNGLTLNAGAIVTLNPGIYYIDRGDLSMNGGASLTGTGVTIVFTSSNGHNYAGATINGGATINLTAPTSGPTAGIVIFGDRSMTVGTPFKFEGGSSQTFGGAVYVPAADVKFAGGANSATGCTQLIGNTVAFVGNANFSLNCSGMGTKPMGSALATLIE
jgi:Flp pilus assembly protein TadG